MRVLQLSHRLRFAMIVGGDLERDETIGQVALASEIDAAERSSA